MARGGPDGSGGPHVFVPDLASPDPDQADRHHLTRALRLRDGDPLTVSDGQGRWRACRYRSATLEPIEEIQVVAEPAVPLTVAFALTKGTKPDLVVQKLTEIGIDRIAVFDAERSIVQWDRDKRRRNHERLERIVREAAMQCRRVRLPELLPVSSFAALAVAPAAMAHRDGVRIDASHTTILIGPEGGWSATEAACGLTMVDLGPHVLRAETAAIAAGIRMVAAQGR